MSIVRDTVLLLMALELLVQALTLVRLSRDVRSVHSMLSVIFSEGSDGTSSMSPTLPGDAAVTGGIAGDTRSKNVTDASGAWAFPDGAIRIPGGRATETDLRTQRS